MAELVREVLIDAQPETVFEFLTVSEKHVQWVGTTAELDPRPGGVYKVLVNGQHHAVGEFIEVVPFEKVAYSFGWDEPDHPIPAGSTRIDITLTPEGTKTRLRFVHSGLPADAVADHAQGWVNYLERLSLVVSGAAVAPDTADVNVD